jgi:hypothetical protein
MGRKLELGGRNKGEKWIVWLGHDDIYAGTI